MHQTYHNYQTSNTEWLGDIPAHWEVKRLGSILKPISIKNRADLPLLSITREQGVIEKDVDNYEENHNFIPEDLSNYKVLKKGQFGMNKMKAWQGSYGVSEYTGIVSPAYYVFEFIDNIYPRFFHIAIRSRSYISFFAQASDGVRIGQWDLSKSRMKEIPFFAPPLIEQQAIANFLDEQTAKIDHAISQQEQMIGLLKSYKQSLIQTVVTQGLKPNTALRPSGIEWLGDIPTHWEVRKVKYIFDHIKTGTTPTTAIDAFFNGNIQWYTPKDLNNEILTNSERTVSELALSSKEIGLFNADSILVVAIGAIGKSSYMPAAGTFNQQITGFYTKNYDNRYYYFLFKILPSFLLRVANYTTLPILNNDFFKNLLFPLPPLIEQQAIANFLDKQTAKIDHAISQQEQMIGLLKSYKQSLIQTVVTQGLKPNTALRPSGTEWLGDIPAHWEVRKFKSIFKLSKGLSITKQDLQTEGVYCVNYGEVHSKFGFELNHNVHSLKCVEEHYLHQNPNSLIIEGDFVFADTSEDIEGAGNFTLLNYGTKIFAGYHTIIAKPIYSIYSKFMAYQFDSVQYRNQIRTKAQGVKVYSITQSILKDTFCWLPPLIEQQAIANFLDEQTAKIDHAISQQEQMIGLLKSYKQSLIQTVVTQGLKPNTALRPSGIEWLGDIPEKLPKMSSNLNTFVVTLTTINEYIKSLKKYQDIFSAAGRSEICQDKSVLVFNSQFHYNEEIPFLILTQKDFEDIISIVKKRIDLEIAVAESHADQVINNQAQKSDINE